MKASVAALKSIKYSLSPAIDVTHTSSVHTLPLAGGLAISFCRSAPTEVAMSNQLTAPSASSNAERSAELPQLATVTEMNPTLVLETPSSSTALPRDMMDLFTTWSTPQLLSHLEEELQSYPLNTNNTCHPNAATPNTNPVNAGTYTLAETGSSHQCSSGIPRPQGEPSDAIARQGRSRPTTASGIQMTRSTSRNQRSRSTSRRGTRAIAPAASGPSLHEPHPPRAPEGESSERNPKRPRGTSAPASDHGTLHPTPFIPMPQQPQTMSADDMRKAMFQQSMMRHASLNFDSFTSQARGNPGQLNGPKDYTTLLLDMLVYVERMEQTCAEMKIFLSRQLGQNQSIGQQSFNQ